MPRWLKEPFVFCLSRGAPGSRHGWPLCRPGLPGAVVSLSIVEWDNRLRFSQKQVALELGVSRQAVWKAVRRMVQYGIYSPGHEARSLAHVSVNSAVGYYGPLKRRREQRRQAEARQRLEALSEALRAGQPLDVMTLPR